MRHAVTATLALAVLATGVSSSAQTLDPKAVGFMLANEKAKKILAEPLKLQTYEWKFNSSPIVLPPVATHLCVITGVTGKFAGTGEMVRLYIDSAAQGGPRFMLDGQSGQYEMKVTVSCAAKAQFVGSTPAQTWTEEVSGTGSRSGCAQQAIPTNPSIKPSALFLAALGGRFGGAGEAISVQQGLFGPTTLINACSGPITAAVLAVGAAPATPPVYRASTARSTNAAQSTFTFEASANFAESGKRYIVPANDALCGLTAISGKFNGYGQEATLTLKDENGQRWWYMYAGYDYQADKTTGYVKASARCYARDQRPVG